MLFFFIILIYQVVSNIVTISLAGSSCFWTYHKMVFVALEMLIAVIFGWGCWVPPFHYSLSLNETARPGENEAFAHFLEERQRFFAATHAETGSLALVDAMGPEMRTLGTPLSNAEIKAKLQGKSPGDSIASGQIEMSKLDPEKDAAERGSARVTPS